MAKLSSSNLSNTFEFNTSLENLEASGDRTELIVNENSIGVGASDSTTEIICTYIALDTGTGVKSVLLRGMIRNDVWSFTTGDIIYLSNSSPGLISNVRPSGDGDFVQVLGVAINTNTILFDPDKTWMRI